MGGTAQFMAFFRQPSFRQHFVQPLPLHQLDIILPQQVLFEQLPPFHAFSLHGIHDIDEPHFRHGQIADALHRRLDRRALDIPRHLDDMFIRVAMPRYVHQSGAVLRVERQHTTTLLLAVFRQDDKHIRMRKLFGQILPRQFGQFPFLHDFVDFPALKQRKFL